MSLHGVFEHTLLEGFFLDLGYLGLDAILLVGVDGISFFGDLRVLPSDLVARGRGLRFAVPLNRA